MRGAASILGVDSRQFWQLLWPRLVAIVAVRVLSFALAPGWNPSLVPAPGVSMLDAIIFFWAGFDASRQTGRIVTGIALAATTSVLGFLAFVIYAIIGAPRLLVAPFEKPFIVVILLALFAIALVFAIVIALGGAAIGRRWTPSSALASTFGTPH